MFYHERKPAVVARLLSLLLLMVLLVSAPLRVVAQADDHEEEDANVAIITRVIEEMINQGDLSVADEIVDPAYVRHDRDGTHLRCK